MTVKEVVFQLLPTITLFIGIIIGAWITRDRY